MKNNCKHELQIIYASNTHVNMKCKKCKYLFLAHIPQLSLEENTFRPLAMPLMQPLFVDRKQRIGLKVASIPSALSASKEIGVKNLQININQGLPTQSLNDFLANSSILRCRSSI